MTGNLNMLSVSVLRQIYTVILFQAFGKVILVHPNNLTQYNDNALNKSNNGTRLFVCLI